MSIGNTNTPGNNDTAKHLLQDLTPVNSDDLSIEQNKTPKKSKNAYYLDMLLEPFDTFADKIEHAHITGEKIGPITGFPKIDDELCGALYPGLHVVHGNTGAGKTAFALQVAASCGFPALYVSCEMSALELLRRITARVTETPLHKFKNPKCCITAKEQKEKARVAMRSAPNLIIADSTIEFWNTQKILDHARMIKENAKTEHVLIIIDSLNTWAAMAGTNEVEYERLSVAIRSLRGIASELDCPVLYISEQTKQANREENKNKDLGSSATAGNRGIEYGAETVIGLKAEVDSNGKPILDGLYCTPVSVTFNKNRNGAAGKPIKMTFDGALQKFEEVGN